MAKTAALLALLAMAGLATTAALAARGDLALVSRADGVDGAAGDGDSAIARISGDGRFVAFRSGADNLSDDDANNRENVFLRDVQTGTTTLVNRVGGPDGAGSGDGADEPMPSADGRYVVFQSFSNDLSAEDADPVLDVFVRDVQQNTTTLVSRADGSDGAGGADASNLPRISADGRRVVFSSKADNVSAEDDDTQSNIFVRDLDAQTTVLVNRADGAAGAPANGVSGDPSISADGRYVAFLSGADNLSDDDNNAYLNIFVRDLEAETTTFVSRATGATGVAADASSSGPAISGDGRFVAFTSAAANLSGEDVDPVEDIFVRDLQEGTTTLVSRAAGAAGAPGDAGSDTPSISADGRFVMFESNANTLADGENEGVLNIFVRDLRAGSTMLVTPAGDDSSYTYGFGLSASGRYAAFESQATTFSSEDGATTSDVFRADVLGDPPQCTSATAEIAHATPTAVTLPCSDTEGDALTRAIVAAPAHGTLSAIDQAAGTVVYTPAAGYSGPDSFSFQASDASASSAAATVNLTVGVAGPFPGACANLLGGSAAAETLSGSAAGDRLIGLGGGDVLNGLAGDDCLFGGGGNDRLRGGGGKDTLDGGRGRDRMAGGSGGDRLADRRGADRFKGGAGNDRIVARDRRRRDRRVRDRIACGSGRDRVTADRRDRVARNCERVRRRRS